MKNISSAAVIAVIVLLNAAVAWKRPGIDVPLTLLLTIPPLWFLMPQFRMKNVASPLKSPSSLAPYLISLLITACFTYFIYWKVSNSVVTFYEPYMQGWRLHEGLFMLLFGVASASCGLVIWTSAHYNRCMETGAVDRLWITQILYAEKSELFRFTTYLLAMIFLWTISVQALRPLIGRWPNEYLFISMGRVAIPLIILLPTALIRLPMSIAVLIAAVGQYLMVMAVVGYGLAALFVAVQLVLISVALVYRYLSIGDMMPPMEKTESAEATQA